MEGLVIRNTGSSYVVTSADGTEYTCKVKGNFRLKGIRTTNPVAVGDHVDIQVNADGSAYITAIGPRKNYIIRRASNLSKEAHIIAANLDQVFLTVTLTHPVTSLTFIDRFLATAEAYRIPAFLVINKTDLLTENDEDREYLEAVTYLYRSIGYEVMHTSAYTGYGIDELKEHLSGKITLMSGNSGVGKSSLINRIIPGLDLRTAEISATHLTGMHTTTFSQMFPIPDDPGYGYIIDTPGIKGFGTIDFDRNEVSHFFPEIFKISEACRFNNCTHVHEPGCAVLEALNDHRISESRYNSYLSILNDSEPDKYRKPF
ncbi:MAG: ribosome small subunit-dependent GTPase A [Muribaculaceae bacterium]|nr:ribosome small subunit-dependent GTPase A [Muribaculaceae bacterium]